MHFVSLIHNKKQVQVLFLIIYPLSGQILGFDLVLLYKMWLFYNKKIKHYLTGFGKRALAIFWSDLEKNTPNVTWNSFLTPLVNNMHGYRVKICEKNKGKVDLISRQGQYLLLCFLIVCVIWSKYELIWPWMMSFGLGHEHSSDLDLGHMTLTLIKWLSECLIGEGGRFFLIDDWKITIWKKDLDNLTLTEVTWPWLQSWLKDIV